MDAISPAALDAAGGQLVTLSGTGFNPITTQVAGGTVVRELTEVKIFEANSPFGETVGTDVTVLDNNHLTFVSPPNVAAGPNAYLLLIGYQNEANGPPADVLFRNGNLPLEDQFLFAYVGASWWFNPTSNHFRYAVDTPGEPFVASDPPTVTVSGVSPRST